jgi:tetratricopeptide (TPR) repeat protein
MSLLFIIAVASDVPGASCLSLPKPIEASAHLSDLFDYDKPAESEERLTRLAQQALACGNRDLAAESFAQVARAQGVQGYARDAEATLAKAKKLAIGTRARSRIALETGRIARRTGRTDQAKALITEAFESAAKAGEDALAADAAHMLALLETGEGSVRWTERGLAIAEASTDPTARRWVGNLAFNAGMNFREGGNHEAAALMFARSLAARIITKDAELIAVAELALSVELAELGRVIEAKAIQERLLRENIGNPELANEIRAELGRIAARRVRLESPKP